MSKFTELEKGTLVKNGKEYDYMIEIADDFPKKKEGNVRLRIIDERPAIRKVRIRYDPEITMFGDKGASMEVALGYDMKEINKTLKYLLFTLLMPFYLVIVAGLLMFAHKIPNRFLPLWTLWMLIPLGIVAVGLFFKMYYQINMSTLAEYLKARDLKKILAKEGFRQAK
ncbi:hypothetical protein COV19_03490 [Candidatus Woesearchaeota archaeon CG10_big_fil_rev_8_21_14_0_10_44_13]|nr:MAG: hypothetical protein COV19_03490 [Candidatus Woesearchaeota archaeon CG10_big_fil_rev_8_21_14_0_10_44_13]